MCALQDEMARAFPRELGQTEGFLYSFELGLEFKGRVQQKIIKMSLFIPPHKK